MAAGSGRLKQLFAPAALLAGVFLAAVMLAAGQLLPTAEYLAQSQRAAQVGYDFAATYSFWPWRFLTLIAPDMFGSPARGDYWGYANYWEDAAYIGLLPLILGLTVGLGAVWKRVRAWRMQKSQELTDNGVHLFLIGLVIVAFLLALGKNTVVFPWLF